MAVPGLDELIAGGLRGRRVFVRADLNVPMADGAITDDTRIRASLPTIQKLRDAGARIVAAGGEKLLPHINDEGEGVDC